ncbi:hypothetical protein [Streptomyces sparsogenes]|uniref:hypothetical protein n=1 Tax=Streptomyces sparsogenes TaxID=67365 RepID=UPI00340DA221
MDDKEVMKRVVGILTEAREVSDRLVEDVDREDLSPDGLAMGELLSEATRIQIEVPGDASPQEVVDALLVAVGPTINQLAGCFTAAFLRLAEVHDSGRTDVTSADVLRKLALDWDATTGSADS